MFKKRCRLLRALRQRGTDHDRLGAELSQLSEEIKQSYDEEEQRNEEKAASNIKMNSKAFFSYANRKKTIRSKIGPLNSSSGGLEDGPKKMAEILSLQYKSVFSEPIQDKELDDLKSFFEPEESQLSFPSKSDIILSQEKFVKAMKSLSPTAAAGRDGFSAFLLHYFAEELAEPLALLWRQSLDTGEMLEGINIAAITPIFKGGDKSVPKNYRPVALTSHLTKVFEKVLREEIVEHLLENDLLNQVQHGFTQGRSTLTQLITYFDEILRFLEAGGEVHSVYLDYAKAFDKCDHKVILRKLRQHGVCGKIGVWIANFLGQRQQVVVVDGTTSDPVWVKSGVPQGSVIGPLLFLILISDINKDVKHSSLGLFADDTRVWKHVSSEQDSKSLQQDLGAVYNWAKENNMEFNSDKFECISFGGGETKQNYLSPSEEPIVYRDSLRDLGVIMSKDCTFRPHIQNVITKASRMAGWVLRTFKTRERQVMLTLYKQLVLSQLEYCCPVWAPTDVASIMAIEAVQRAYTRRIQGMSGKERPDYWTRLKTLKLYSLERRRERYTVLYMWKIIRGLVPNPGITTRWNPRTGMHINLPIVGGSCHIQKLRRESVLYRGPRLFDSLPSALRQMEDVNLLGFKRKLDNWLANVLDQPTVRGLCRASPTNSIIDQVKYM